MKEQIVLDNKESMIIICNKVRGLVESNAFEDCDIYLKSIIGKFPHAPEPHNLFGMLLEKEGEHVLAMKHFRVAWALDPTYLPARYNMDVFGTIFTKGKGAFDESDCPPLVEQKEYKVEYDKFGLGRIVRV